MAGNRAPSVINYFHYDGPGDILVQNVNVPKRLCAKYTYYCCLNWNMGAVGGGYCGIQCHEDGNCFICSLWDPPSSCGESIKPVYRSSGKSFTERFGGEGTGLKYMNFEQKWKCDQWYTLVMRRWDQHEKTYFGLWVRDVCANKWTHMVTMEFPVPNVYFKSPTASFVEDWHGNGELARGALFKETFKRSISQEWECMKACHYFVNQEDACKNWNNNFFIGPTETECSFVLQTGGNTEPNLLSVRGSFDMPGPHDCRPNIAPMEFEIKKAINKQIHLEIANSSTPLFSYQLSKNGFKTSPIFDSESRLINMENLENCTTVEVILQDIVGHTVTKSVSVDVM